MASEDTEAKEDVEEDFGREAVEKAGADVVVVMVEVEGVARGKEEEETTEGCLEKACICAADSPPSPTVFAEAYMAPTATATEPPIQGTWESKQPFPSLDVRESTERRLGPGPVPPFSPSRLAEAAAAATGAADDGGRC